MWRPAAAGFEIHFFSTLDSIDDVELAKDELLELKENQKVKMELDSMELTTFWCHQ